MFVVMQFNDASTHFEFRQGWSTAFASASTVTVTGAGFESGDQYTCEFSDTQDPRVSQSSFKSDHVRFDFSFPSGFCSF